MLDQHARAGEDSKGGVRQFTGLQYRLPNPGNQSIWRANAILCVTAQMLSERSLLVDQPKYQGRNEQYEQRNGHIRAQRHWHGQHGDDEAEIHRMAHKSVRPSIDHCLFCFYSNRAPGERIGSITQ